MFFRMVYKSGRIFLPFCHNTRVWQTAGQTDGRIEFSSQYRVCITCSAVKIGDFAPTRSLWSKISDARGRPPPIIFARSVRPMNALQLCRWQFSHKLRSRLSSSEVQFFYGNRPFCFFETPFGDLGATYDDHLRLIRKRIVDFLLVLIELFSLGVTAEALRAISVQNRRFCSNEGRLNQNFR